ncbi:putative D,D-dipeptide transport system permease protein DdpC [Mesorhizobium sp. J8]|nr:ABC transporter permease [Mesorhizobium sp. J8]BCM20774.1 putative D,D-dipeptide transport system permease protein DdpC [Mesorhizobium sp. J8]
MSISTQPARRTTARPKGVLLPLALLVLVILAAFTLLPGLIAPHDPIALAMADRLKPPSLTHIFGTDEGGRDVFSRIVYGTRYSLGVATAIVFASALFGVVYGAVSGMARQGIDNLMMRIVDLFFGFPALVLALAVAASIGRGLDSVALSLAIIWWPGYARLVRGEVLRLRERPHVEAARALGVSEMTILRRHIIPFVVQEVNVRVTTDIGYALVAVTALSFLGLGANSPTPEWGLLIRDSRPYFGSAWWYLVFPGTMIMLTATAFSLIGDALASRRAA